MDIDSYSNGEMSGRSMDIELGGQEVITIELDNLDPNPEDIVDLLKEAQCKASVWNKLACEYWKKGYWDAATSIAEAAIELCQSNGTQSSLPPVYLLLANLNIAKARGAPKVPPLNRQDGSLAEKVKDKYYTAAASFMNTGDKIIQSMGGDARSQAAFLTRGIHQLATRSLEDALQSFEGVLAERPTNVVALLGKARILFTRRQFPQALKYFQQLLTLRPDMIPDPRVGIGMCFWAMDNKAKARAAWERSLELNPSSWAVRLLLGLDKINLSKDLTFSQEERTQHYVTGTKHIEKAFNSNKASAAAANALCDFFMRKGDQRRALRLAERTVQYADTLAILSDGYIHVGQLAQLDGRNQDAIGHFTSALKGNPKNALAAIGLAQVQIKNDDYLAAIHTLETLLQPPNQNKLIEAVVMLASLHSYPRPGLSSSELVQERTRARELYDSALKLVDTSSSVANSHITEDVHMHVEIARLWQDDNIDRMRRALQDALQISEANAKIDPSLLNNLAVLGHLQGNLTDAQSMYTKALTSTGSLESDMKESVSTSILYNLARVYEDQGEEDLAKEAYDKLLVRHPEYVDAKIRQAELLARLNRGNDAHELIKQALVSQSSNLDVRAFYTHFLIQNNMIKPARDFVFNTLKDFDKHDVYSLCAAGWIHYHQSREGRDMSSADRARGFQRSAEFFDKALQQDPSCAIAAQGLAIATAEDVLAASTSEDPSKRIKTSREALEIFGKIRESISDGSVYLNMGHCYYLRDEYDRAIEFYETALRRTAVGQNVNILLFLCRAWYAKANKDQSFPSMLKSLKFAQMVLHIQPNDKATLYNIAMIQQKSVELMFGILPAKRTLKDLQYAISQGAQAQKLFAALASDKSSILPYNRDIADQRRKYGDNMLRKSEEHLNTQRQHEEEVEARLQIARQRRQDERERQNALERKREEELRVEAEKLAEQRREARKAEWTQGITGSDEDEKQRKPRRAKKAPRAEGGSGDEAPAPEPKKRAKGRLRKEGDAEAGGEDGLFSGDEGGDRPVKKRSQKKRVVRDDDEEEATASAPRKKQFLSKETISDSDEEM